MLTTTCLLAVAVATPLGLALGPHFDPRTIVDPTDVVYPAYLSATQQAARLVLLGCCAVALTTRSGRSPLGGGVVAALLAFSGVNAAAAVLNANGATSAVLTVLQLAPVVVFWTSGQSWADTLRVLRWALRLIVWPSLLLGLAGPAWASWPSGFGRSLAGIPQLVGVTEHPNALGPAAGMLLILEIARPRGRHWVLRGVVAAAILLVAQSRTAWVAVAVGLLLSAAVSRSGLRRWAAVGSSGLLLYWLTTTPPSADFTGRPAVWAYAWQVFRDHMVTGAGPGFLMAAAREGQLPAELGWLPRHAHNQFLHTAAAAGVLGVATLVALLLTLAVAAAKAGRATNGASMALLGVLLTRCLTEVPLSTGVTGFLLNLVFFAAVFAGLRERRAAADRDPKFEYKTREFA